MKLLTHNMLQCHIKGVKNGYPFKIEAQTIENREADYDPDFLRHIFSRIQWDAFREAAIAMGKSASRSKTATSSKTKQKTSSQPNPTQKNKTLTLQKHTHAHVQD